MQYDSDLVLHYSNAVFHCNVCLGVVCWRVCFGNHQITRPRGFFQDKAHKRYLRWLLIGVPNQTL